MITSDREKRNLRLQALMAALREQVPAEDRELLLSFAPVVFAEMPDRLALHLPVEALSARILRHFQFVAHEIPPAIQLYRGLPGIHVSVRTPADRSNGEARARAELPLETTVIETHTVDAPFIYDSLKNYLRKAGLRVFSAIHPIFTVRRQWERVVWIGGPHEDATKEVYCHFEIEPIDSDERRRRILHEIFSVLKCVFLAVDDFAEMLSNIRSLRSRLHKGPGSDGEVESSGEFLDWLLDENYIFLGTARYRVGGEGKLERIQDSLGGVFTDATLLPVVLPGVVEEVESHILPASGDAGTVHLDYCNNAAAIYHLEPIDGIVVREWSEDGRLDAATLLIGRFARGAFSQRADHIPMLRDKLDWLLEKSGAVVNSHIYREIRATFNRLPLRELLYANPASLKSLIDPIVFMMGDDEISVQCREGVGYVMASVAFSRLHYSYGAEENLTRALSDNFGPISFHTSAECGAASLLQFYFDTSLLIRPVDPDAIRRIATPLVTTWEGRVAAALDAVYGEREGRRLFRRYVRPESRSGLYREVTPPEQVPDDLRHFEALESRLEVRVQARTGRSALLHLYSIRSLGLTDTLRTLHNIGLEITEEMRVPLTLPEGRRCFHYRFEIEASPRVLEALLADPTPFTEALRALDEERATDDPLNSLVLMADLSWRDVELLRTLRNHLLQIRPHYNAETVNSVLIQNWEAARALFRLFCARFDPKQTGDRDAAAATAEAEVQSSLEKVRSLAEDEVLRALGNLVRSAVRTNFFQRPERPAISVKVDCRKVEGMRSPRPMFEIYVHSRLLEGIHLRGGRVARGGIRWSDRQDDFRREILGLMKTQMVKNSIIVPVGSKGGFVLKGKVPTRPALDAYLVDRYREFISTLLDITDNIVDGKILHPPEVVRQDTDDPYLVVAADKGTAHLSDTANSVSSQYGFWLGDAFASGGSAGYDHKKVGITARGAWECVKHHFGNLGIDVQTQPITIAGIGDMGGDVFGNGLLQSRHLKLVAAFNHAHIFIDPDPDPEKSYRERERLFRMPRSSWRDYDGSLLSRGGGIFDRSAKSIALSPEMQALLGLETPSATGEEVIRRILKAPIDLLYNGGIGTYVKASSEENADVGDRTNDSVRVDGREVRARVVAEGGNLGLTQRGRLEYAQLGGLLNTDAIDNSGGVDMSDHEVNIKILLDILVKKGLLPGRNQRNTLLAEMTEDVAGLVLKDNESQARAITLDGLRSARSYEEFVARMEEMVAAEIVNRADEDLPRRGELLAYPARERGLARPLLAVLLGYTKMWAFGRILQTDLPEDPAAETFLENYFPRQLREHSAGHFKEHTLRREIIATAAVNYAVNNGGILLLPRLMAGSNREIGAVLGAYLTCDKDSGARGLRFRLLDARLPAGLLHETLLELEAIVEAATSGFLEGKGLGGASEAIRDLGARVQV